ncbi:MAG: pyridoxamine 5'-phosphate oxidase family protein [Verrucomicrobiales bacterium]
MNEQEIIDRARTVVFDSMGSGGLGLLSTADDSGFPHATWMATMAPAEERQLVTLTSPDSRKVANIRSNPRVEWLFTGPEKADLVYLSGSAEIVSEMEEVKSYWNLMKEKDLAFFLDHFNTGMGFAIIRTQVESATLVQPQEHQSHELDPSELWKSIPADRT